MKRKKAQPSSWTFLRLLLYHCIKHLADKLLFSLWKQGYLLDLALSQTVLS